MRLKILFIDFALPKLWQDKKTATGGFTVQLNSWFDGLRQLDHPVGLIVDKDQKVTIDYPNLSVLRAYKKGAGLPLLKWFTIVIPSLKEKAKAYQPDFIFQGVANLQTGIMAHVAKSIGVPFVYRVANDIEADERIKEKLPIYAYKAFRYGVKSAHLILCQNQYQHDKFKAQFPNKHYAIIHNPFVFDGERKAPLAREERSFVAWLGLFQDQKNMGELLKVVELMPDLKFKIGGKETNRMSAETRKAFEALKTKSNVEFVGFISRDEINSFLSKALLVLNTSHYEGFSNTFLEAFAAGTPVVTRKNTDPDHIIERNGLGVAVEKYKEIAAGITKLIGAENYNRICQNCQDYVFDLHDPKKQSERLLNILEKVK